MKVLLECGHVVEFKTDMLVSSTSNVHYCHFCGKDKDILEVWQ